MVWFSETLFTYLYREANSKVIKYRVGRRFFNYDTIVVIRESGLTIIELELELELKYAP